MADYKDDIGYNRLLDEQGINMPDGSGIIVTHAEAETGDPPRYLPNISDSQFTAKTITDISGINPTGLYSGHATSVGKRFYGNISSIAPMIDTINAYSAGYWLGSNYLRATQGRYKPVATPDRVANHSWVGNDSDDAVDLDILKRVDWAVDNDEFIQAVGLTNGTSTNPPLLSAAFNVIAVGVTDGVHGRSTVSLGLPYISGRTRPNLVTPFTTTSSATPVVAAAAALLVDVGNSMPSLSTDTVESSTSNRFGGTVYNAERSEVVKAVLMAGADRATDNSTNPDPNTPKDISDYRVDSTNQSDNGLDKRYGAGQLNIYNSYHIQTAGEQNSIEDNAAGGGSIGAYGFDYDPSFGGAGNSGGSNVTGSYYFSTGSSPVLLTATLAWNVEVADRSRFSFPGAATLYDIDLHLYDETSGGHVLVASSISTIDNTENIWIQLDVNRDYFLEVSPKAGQSAFEWDYALAWQMLDAIDTDSDGILDVIDRDDDNDDLSDTDEVIYGTNPLLTDTDADGLADDVEVGYDGDISNYNPYIIGSGGTDLNANNADTDGDGIDDATEYNNSTGDEPINPGTYPHLADGNIAPLGNPDSIVNAADVLVAQRIALGLVTASPLEIAHGDMNCDDQINLPDVLLIQRIALGETVTNCAP